jgi:hypothetical protein
MASDESPTVMKPDEAEGGRPGERVETAVSVLITQRSQVQILPPLL